MSSIVRQMIDALACEIEAARRKGSGGTVELRDGRRLRQADGRWLYRFRLDERHVLQNGSPVEVGQANEERMCFVEDWSPGAVVISTPTDLGPNVPHATLRRDPTFLLERLCERLDAVKDGVIDFDREAADRVIGREPARTGDREPRSCVLADAALNEEQELAVRRAMGSDLLFLWGPPGTGKTMTVARIVEAHVREGRSVLIVSNTNMAVDTALEKICERLENLRGFDEGVVRRDGVIVKRSLYDRFGDKVDLDRIVARLVTPLVRRREELETACRQARRDVAHLERLLTIAAERKQMVDRLAQLEKHEREIQDAIADCHRTRSELGKRRDELARQVREERPSPVLLALGARPRSTVHGDLGRVRRLLDQEAERENELSKALDRIADERSELRRRLREVGEAGRVDRATLTKRIRRLRAAIERQENKKRRIDERLKCIRRDVQRNCRVLATTAYQAFLRNPERFDVVVVDEASMLIPPVVYYVAGLSRRAVVVAGDFRQLPPIVQVREQDNEAAHGWLARDVFQLAGVPESLYRREEVPFLMALRTQYRMRPEICRLVNTFYPDNPLRSHSSVERPRDEGLGLPPDAPLLYVDVSHLAAPAMCKAGTHSRFNLLSALVVRDLVRRIAASCREHRRGPLRERLGVITPYVAQAELINAVLEAGGPEVSGLASTVHRFQGNERDVIVIDLVDSSPLTVGRPLKGRKLEDSGLRMLNVALSRARRHVVLVADFAFLRRRLPRDSRLLDVLDRFEDEGEPIDLPTGLPREDTDGAGRSTGWRGLLSSSVGGEDCLMQCLRDVANAGEFVVVMSPTWSSVNWWPWMRALESAVHRGARARVITSERAATRIRGMVGDVREAGIGVDLRRWMSETLLIVDGEIAWLSRDPVLGEGEIPPMVRVRDRETVRAVVRLLTDPRRRSRGGGNAVDALSNPNCGKCGGPTVRAASRKSPGIIKYRCPGCTRSGNAPRTGRVSRSGGRNETAFRPCPSPRCGGRLVERMGRYGPFLGCSNYPRCRHTENVVR